MINEQLNFYCQILSKRVDKLLKSKIMIKNIRKKLSTYWLKALFLCSFMVGETISADAQAYSIILGRPTDTSITASVMFDNSMQYYIEYGVQSGT